MLIRAQDGTATQRTFTHVPTSIEAEEAEEIGVEHLLRDVASTSGAPSSSLLTTQSLSTRVASQMNALEGLSARLNEISDYVLAVRKGQLPVNHQIIYHLQEIMGLLPQLGGDVDVGKAFRVGNNDSSLVVYLSSLIRTVLALHDLSEWTIGEATCWRRCADLTLVENRITNAQQEIEDAKSPEERKVDEAAAAAGVKTGSEKSKKDGEGKEEKK